MSIACSAPRAGPPIASALAALLDERVRQVTLIHAPASYSGLAEASLQDWPFSAMLPGVLASFDLPDIYRALEVKGMQAIEPQRNAELAMAGKETS